MPIYTLGSVTVSRVRPSWPVIVKTALDECDPLTSDFPTEDCTSWRGFASAPEAGGWAGDIPAGHVGLRTWSRPYIGRRWR